MSDFDDFTMKTGSLCSELGHAFVSVGGSLKVGDPCSCGETSYTDPEPLTQVPPPLALSTRQMQAIINSHAEVAKAKVREALREFERVTGAQVVAVKPFRTHRDSLPSELALVDLEWRI